MNRSPLNTDEKLLSVIFDNLTRKQVANLLKLTKDLGHERLVCDRKISMELEGQSSDRDNT